MQVHLTQVYRATQDKQGNPYISKKTGKNYERVSIKTQEHNDKWLSGFGSEWNKNWDKGDVVDIKVEQNGEYLNFSKADPVEGLEARVKALEQAVFNKPDDDLPF